MNHQPQTLLTNNLTALVILDRAGASERTYEFIDGPDTQIPALYPGYQMYLTSFSESRLPALLRISEEEETTESVEPSRSKIRYTVCDKACQTTTDIKNGEDDEQDGEVHWLVAIAIFVIVLAYAVFAPNGLAPFLASHNPGYGLEEFYPSVNDTATLTVPTEDVGAQDVCEASGTEEAPALRDWVDCLLGWSGEVCKRE